MLPAWEIFNFCSEYFILKKCNFRHADSSLLVDYEFFLDPRYNKDIISIQTTLNSLFASPENIKNQLLKIKLPFENIDNTLPIVIVPSTTSKFNSNQF